jgi:RNA polymerase subunit RPABC4/transcription elongation factor Spt4
MQVNNETQSGFQTEIKIVPGWAWALAGIGFLCMQVVFNVVVAKQHDAPPAPARALLGGLVGIMLGCYMLFVGYVNRDSKRRGMSPAIWTCVALFIPNALGIIVYFVLRQPLRSTCPQCGHFIQSGFNFCPQCNCKLSPNCPQCQRAVSLTDVYCPYCGTGLRNQPAPALSSVQHP